MSDFSRRDLVRIAAVAATAGALEQAQAQHVHNVLADQKIAGVGSNKLRLLNEHEAATLRRLAELIIPADERSPSAAESGAVEFIDLLASNNKELETIYTGGLAWLDHEMGKRYGSTFLQARPEQQIAMLDLIAYRKNAQDNPDLLPGITFFGWARRMVVDAFYSSPLGVRELDFRGNKAVAKFEVPQEVIDYALRRSPV